MSETEEPQYFRGHRIWAESEEKKLLTSIQSEISLEEIAHNHNRSLQAIMARLKKIAKQYKKKGYTNEQIKELTRIELSDETKEKLNTSNNEKDNVFELFTQIMNKLDDMNIRIKKIEEFLRNIIEV
jgi:hypothetical protein